MSGRRKTIRSDLKFKVEADLNFTFDRAAELRAEFQANPAAASDWTPAERLAMLKLLVLEGQAFMHPDLVARLAPGVANDLGLRVATGSDDNRAQPRRVGRPKGSGADLLAEYELDTEHMQVFREAGFADVPPDKDALSALQKRNPSKPENTIKVALRRARKDRRK